MRKKSVEKKTKSCTLLKRPKIAFLGEQKSATKKAPLQQPRSVWRGAFLVARFRSVFLYRELPPEAEIFQDLVSEMKEKTPPFFQNGIYKKSTIIKILKNKSWGDDQFVDKVGVNSFWMPFLVSQIIQFLIFIYNILY